MPTAAIETLRQLAARERNNDWEATLAAERIVSSFGDPDVAALIEALSLSDWNVRLHVADALGRIASAEAAAAILILLKWLNIGYPSISVAAAYICCRLDPAEIGFVLPVLPEALKDADVRVRLAAAKALVDLEVDDEETLLPLIGALRDEEEPVRWLAATALVKFGPRAKFAFSDLIWLLNQPEESCFSEYVRGAVAEALANIGDQAALPAIRGCLNSEDNYVTLQVATAVWKLTGNGGEVMLVIEGALRQYYGDAKAQHVLGVLKDLDEEKAQEVLAKMMDGDGDDVLNEVEK